MDEQIRHRFTALTTSGASRAFGMVGVSTALTIATLGMAAALLRRLGQIAGELAVLISHVQLR